MKVDVAELDGCRRQLTLEAPEAEVAAAWDAACGRVQREARLPGFRPGKVPRTLVRTRFADDVRRAVAEALVPAVYRRALDETGLHPVEEPDVKDLQLEEGQPLRFTAVVEIKPTISLADYRGLRVTHDPTTVTETDVEAALQRLVEQRGTLVAVTRPARVGDYVVVDSEISFEGESPRSERGTAFEVGRGHVLPEMDEAVIGLEAGAERRLAVRFGGDHPQQTLRGKAGELTLRVVEVKEKELPELDDEFAKSLGSHDSLAELRAAVQAGLQAERDHVDRHRLEEVILDAALTAHDFPAPASLVAREVGRRIDSARERIRRQGMDPDTLPWDYSRLETELRPDATRAVRRALLLEAIADREAVAVGDDEVDAQVAQLAEGTGRAPQALRALLERRGDLEGLRLGLREGKVIDLLVRAAEVTPPPAAQG